MKNISAHILDIAFNSIEAKATKITIALLLMNDTLHFRIKDNGIGMNKETLQNITDPFFTSRHTRKIGMGIPLLLHNSKATGGSLSIKSKQGKGTQIESIMNLNSIDMIPMGDISGAVTLLICNNPDIDINFSYQDDKNEFFINTKNIKKAIDQIPIYTPEIRKFIKDIIHENIKY